MSTTEAIAPQQSSVPEWAMPGQTVTVITQSCWQNVAVVDRKVTHADDHLIVLSDGTRISDPDAGPDSERLTVKTSQRWGDTDVFIAAPDSDLAITNRRALASHPAASVA